jgi:hypothetical protein
LGRLAAAAIVTAIAQWQLRLELSLSVTTLRVVLKPAVFPVLQRHICHQALLSCVLFCTIERGCPSLLYPPSVSIGFSHPFQAYSLPRACRVTLPHPSLQDMAASHKKRFQRKPQNRFVELINLELNQLIMVAFECSLNNTGLSLSFEPTPAPATFFEKLQKRDGLGQCVVADQVCTAFAAYACDFADGSVGCQSFSCTDDTFEPFIKTIGSGQYGVVYKVRRCVCFEFVSE